MFQVADEVGALTSKPVIVSGEITAIDADLDHHAIDEHLVGDGTEFISEQPGWSPPKPLLEESGSRPLRIRSPVS